MSYEGIITVEPGKRGGQPCIRGMRITVYDVLSYLASGMTEQQLLEEFPYLTREDILACLSYAAEREHRTCSLTFQTCCDPGKGSARRSTSSGERW